MHKTVILQTLSCIHLSFHTVRAELLSDYIERPLSASGMIDKNVRAKRSFFLTMLFRMMYQARSYWRVQNFVLSNMV